MTTVTNFVPSVVAPFQFSAELDGEQYNVTVTWNLFRSSNNQNGGFYVNVVALDGTLVTSRALVGSPTAIPIKALSWSQNTAVATTSVPHGYKIGRVVELTISGCAPTAFNGRVQCLITGTSTFSWALSGDPGAATVFGSAAYNVDLVGGYFQTSTLVFRQAAQQFEAAP